MRLTTDQEIAGLLKRTKTIALVGASPKTKRASHGVMRFLLDQGYDVYPVNPNAIVDEIHGRNVYPDLASIPVAIDMVDVFRQSQFLPGVTQDAIVIGAKAVWSQLDVMSEEAEEIATQANLPLVMDRCPAIEIPRLQKLGLM